MTMSNYSDVFFSLDANRNAASVTPLKSTQVDSDREEDSAMEPTGFCTLYVDFFIDDCTYSKELLTMMFKCTCLE